MKQERPPLIWVSPWWALDVVAIFFISRRGRTQTLRPRSSSSPDLTECRGPLSRRVELPARFHCAAPTCPPDPICLESVSIPFPALPRRLLSRLHSFISLTLFRMQVGGKGGKGRGEALHNIPLLPASLESATK